MLHTLSRSVTFLPVAFMHKQESLMDDITVVKPWMEDDKHQSGLPQTLCSSEPAAAAE